MKIEKAIKNQIKKINPKYRVDKFPKEFTKIITELEDFIAKNQTPYLNFFEHKLSCNSKTIQVS